MLSLLTKSLSQQFSRGLASNNLLKTATIYLYTTTRETTPITRYHGYFRYDDNHDLRYDTEEQERMLDEEDKQIEAFNTQIEPLIEKYYKISIQRVDMNTSQPPEKNGPYYYFSKHAVHGENDYEIIYRKPINSDKEELVLNMLDIPFLHKSQYNTVCMTKLVLSDDQSWLAAVVDPNNDENLVICFRNLTTGKFMRDRIPNADGVVFSKSNPRVIFYTKHDHLKRPYQIRKHLIGDDPDNDEIIFEEKDPGFYLDIKVSKDKKYLLIHSSSKSCNEIHVLDRDQDKAENPKLIKLVSKKSQMRAFANHARDEFLVVCSHNLQTSDSKLCYIKDADFAVGNMELKDLYVPEKYENVTEIDLFKDFYVLYLHREGNAFIKIIDHAKNQTKLLNINQEIGLIDPGINEDYDTKEFIFYYNNPFVFNSIYKYNYEHDKIEVLQAAKFDGPKFNSSAYCIKRINAPTHDGKEVPITLVQPKNLKLNRRNKVLMFGYGAYGQPVETTFNIVNWHALENGWVLAYAHVRGGNEKGRLWHQEATGTRKINSFTDFISAAEHLVAEGYTHPSLLCAYGSSAGGYLIGGVINMRPNLFKAVIMDVPFLDVLSSLLDETLPIVQSDYDEWGNPTKDKKAYESIASLCPYENLSTQEYPTILISAGLHDYRCPVWNVLKYLKRYRQRAKVPQKVEEIAPKNALLLVKDGGHAGEVGSNPGIRQKAFYYAFLDYVLLRANKEILDETGELKEMIEMN